MRDCKFQLNNVDLHDQAIEVKVRWIPKGSMAESDNPKLDHVKRLLVLYEKSFSVSATPGR